MLEPRPLPLTDSAAQIAALDAMPWLVEPRFAGWTARYGAGLVWDEAQQVSVMRERVLVVEWKRKDDRS